MFHERPIYRQGGEVSRWAPEWSKDWGEVHARRNDVNYLQASNAKEEPSGSYGKCDEIQWASRAPFYASVPCEILWVYNCSYFTCFRCLICHWLMCAGETGGAVCKSRYSRETADRRSPSK